MTRVLARLVITTCLITAPLAFADVQYQQTSQMTGGSMLQMLKMLPGASRIKDPQVSTVVFKGNRMGRRSAHVGEIIDLDQKTITNINFDKKTYSTVTFEQMKQTLQQMTAEAQSSDASQAKPDLKFDVDLKETGQVKAINGMEAREFVMKIAVAGSDAKSGASGTMKIDSNMWVTSAVPGGPEMRSFYERMSKDIDWAPGAMGVMLNRPDLQRAMSKMMAEGGRMKGTSILQTMRMYADGLGGGSTQAAAPQRPSVAEALGGSLGGRLGGLGGFGKKKPAAEPASAPPSGSGGPEMASSALIEMSIESTGFKESGVDESVFQIPSDFKKVEEDLKMPRQRR